jgi:choline dehydrogenase-like flavoprotein
LYDYIVVGAGTAGCTLAARLTEHPETQVLLIEAGPPDRRREIQVPAAFSKLLCSSVDWQDLTAPQEHLGGRQIRWPRGRVLGGSGSLSAMIHLRGCPSDYSGWPAGWQYDDLAPFFTEPPVRTLTEPNPLSQAFLDGCESCGLKRYAASFEGPGQSGSGFYPLLEKNGSRWSAARSLLSTALRRGNLTVWTGIQAARVVIEGGRAIGIEYLQKGSRYQTSAAREVILCAGAIGSAQLLLLSGVGPPEDLERLGIPVSAAVPGTGKNLEDHLGVALSYSCTQPLSLSGTATPLNMVRYMTRKDGPLASNVAEAGAFLKSNPDLEACDLEIIFAPLASLDSSLAPPAAHAFSLTAALLTPQSRGQITLASADPLEPPRLDPAYLSHPEDRARLIEGIARARSIAGSEPFAPYRGAVISGDLEAQAQSLHHAAGSCRMGEDGGSVVNAALQVHGVAGLRVADASVMPRIPRAHPNATVTMIAEKAARLIRG